MRIGDGVFDVLGTDGLHELGGFEWDNRLMLWLNEQYQKDGGADLTESFTAEAELREKAELAKRTLSSAPQARVILSHEGVTKIITVTRETFEDLTSDLLNQSRDLTISLVEELGLSFRDIDQVLLVGGSTRMPMVARMLEEIIGKPALRAGNPDELVALGAAIQASLEAGTAEPSPSAGSPVVLDVTSQALGVLALNDERQMRNTIIIRRNTKIPAKGSEFFNTVSDGQTEIKLRVTQGDDEDPEYVRLVTKEGGQLFSIPPYPAGAPIQITFHYDIDQTIQVEVTDLTTAKSLGTFEIDNVANLSDEEVAAARQKNKQLEVN
jgi:molecular chaperone DnaK